MDADDFNRQIRAAWSFFNNLGVGRTVINLSSLGVDEEYRRVILNNNSTYQHIYRCGLGRSHYNMILLDYSYFQFSWSNETDWRLAYWPNPWLSGVPSALAELVALENSEKSGALSHEEVGELMDLMDYQAAIPPIRFEYSDSQYVEMAHPAAHFHIGRDPDNRWPSVSLVGPKVFAMMIGKYYYSDYWRLRSRAFGSEVVSCIEDEWLSALASTGVATNFSDRERRSLHFGRNILDRVRPALKRRRERFKKNR